MAMFPDSGVPPADAKNSLPDVNTAGCNELWYSTARCQPRFDPAAANAMLAEQMNLIMKAEVIYNCTDLTHIERATRYLIQRGYPRGMYWYGGPADYSGDLDPVLTYYNNYLTLTVVPAVNNSGPVRVNIAALGLVGVLRNDAQQLVLDDLKAGVPIVVCYYGGSFYVVGTVASQIPPPYVPPDPTSAVDVWIRTDGNDANDGSSNDPAFAFRTINGCWAAVKKRFAAFPVSMLNMRFGIPGDYEFGGCDSFGGAVSLIGDPGNYTAYRILSPTVGTTRSAFSVSGIADFRLTGVTCDMGTPTGVAYGYALRVVAGSCFVNNVKLTASTTNTNVGSLLSCENGGICGLSVGDLIMDAQGHGLTCFASARVGTIGGGGSGQNTERQHFLNGSVVDGVIELALLSVGSCTTPVITSGVTGPAYYVVENSILRLNGASLGSTAGSDGSGGQVSP